MLFVIGKAGPEINDGALNGIQFILDLAGLVPGLGELADGLNALISLARGNYIDATLSAASMIPFVGWTSTGGKWLKNILKHGDEIADVAKYADEAAEIIEGIAKYGDEVAEGLGKALKEGAEEAAEAAGKYVDDVVEGGKPYTNNRPTYGKSQIDDVWNKNVNPQTGTARDPSGAEIIWDRNISRNGQWDMGHMPDQKYSDIHSRYMQGEISQQEFLKWYRDPTNYRPELPSTNRSHKYEGK